MSDLITDRYGADDPARRRTVVLVSGVVGVVALAWLAWVVWFQSTPDVQSALRSFEVVDNHTVTASVTVKPHDGDIVADCLVRAVGPDRSVVGELNFRVSGAEGTVEREVTVRTEREATSVEMVGCTTKDQPRPR